jgi:hypothetical protein
MPEIDGIGVVRLLKKHWIPLIVDPSDRIAPGSFRTAFWRRRAAVHSVKATGYAAGATAVAAGRVCSRILDVPGNSRAEFKMKVSSEAT